MSAKRYVSRGSLAWAVASGLLCVMAASGAGAQTTGVGSGALATPGGLGELAGGAAPRAAVTPLRPGDHVRVTVWRSPELSGEFTVGADGRLQHPFYKDVLAVGVTPEALRERIRMRLETLEKDPEFLVEPLLRVAVGGEVRTPNLFSVPPGTTVADAILMSGGVTQTGRLDRVRLLRDGQVRKVDLRRTSTSQALIPVQSGDQISVDAKGSFFRDYVVPGSSLVGAIGWVVTLIVRR